MNEPRALVVGATGLSGSYVAAHLKENGYHVSTLARRKEKPSYSDRHIAADLTDREATKAALAPVDDVNQLFICTWSMQANEDENVRVNSAMLQNMFEGLRPAPLEHVALVTGLKHYLGPFEAYGTSSPYSPFLETQPRLPSPNFYYAQEDVLFAEADKRGFTWNVHRPHSMIGMVIGNAMNMAVTLAVYASICRETGRPFMFPGSPQQYNAVADVTDARILAKQVLWAAQTPEAANLPLNIANGDLFRWTWLWAQLADYFGLPVADYPGHPTPLVEQMADAAPIWAKMVEQHGLKPYDVNTLASWWHSDADLGREIECFTDMTNSRRLGFSAYQETRRSFFDVFDALRAGKIIPA